MLIIYSDQVQASQTMLLIQIFSNIHLTPKEYVQNIFKIPRMEKKNM